VRADLLELSKTVDPGVLGARVRAARLRAGLTQTQLAHELMSTAYVSRIESGQRRPDPALLESLAQRLHVTVDELLLGADPDLVAELRVRLDHAQLSLATGDARTALNQLTALLEDPALASLADLCREVSYARAGAYESTGDLQSAIIALEDLAETPPRDLTWLEGMTALSRCYRESGDLVRAIEVGERARTFVEELGLDGVSEAIRLSLTVAAAYFERGDTAHASRLCRRAIDRAERLDSPLARASAYWNASIIESRSGNPGAALPLADRAMRLLEASEDARNVARLRTQLGILQLRTDPPDPAGALGVLVKARAELELTDANPADLADNALAQARAYFLLGDDVRATRRATESAAAAAGGSPLVTADAHVLRGQIAAREGDIETARSRYQRAILVLSGMGADRNAAQLWYELAGLLEEVGELQHALDAYRRAGASTGLVGSPTPVAAQRR
jgi:transcriptional regulator with XRE-family HTH domain/Tfp pilus assembly protein PilF